MSKGIIYIASPLFTPEEKKIITQVATVLHKAGYDTYLPMEHGVPDAWSYPNCIWASKMFELDREAIDNCEAVVCIYYGMNSDSGTAWEVGYSYGKNKNVIIYHHYDTTLEIGSLMICNGASSNVITMEEIPNAIKCSRDYDLPYQS